MTTDPAGNGTLAAEIIDGLAPLLAHHRRAWAARCHAHGLSMVSFGVLALLEMHGALPMSRIAEELDVALPNATGIIGRLAERGIVERAHDSLDRRVVLVGLTDAGRDLIGDMERSRRERITRLIGTMDERQLRRLAASVRDLNQAARLVAAAEESVA